MCLVKNKFCKGKYRAKAALKRASLVSPGVRGTWPRCCLRFLQVTLGAGSTPRWLQAPTTECERFSPDLVLKSAHCKCFRICPDELITATHLSKPRGRRQHRPSGRATGCEREQGKTVRFYTEKQ